MRSLLSAAGVILGACLIAAPAPAAPIAASKHLPLLDSQSNPIQVQHPHGHHGGGGYRGGGGGGWGGDGGAAAAGVIGGLIIGAIIASEAQRQQAINYCARRFRSFDPNTMTYVGRNGVRYRCP